MRLIIITIFLLSTTLSFSQDKELGTPKKHKFYFYWGYNRANFTNSDIHFTGDGYDFTLNDVQAKDRQSEIHIKFLDPTKLTIPQYDYRLGYYLKNDWIISLGFDHMKYVMVDTQNATIDGKINKEYSSEFGGDYDNDVFEITPKFLELEHTDGLNYINIHLDKSFNIWESKDAKYSLSSASGIGTGLLIPRSDVTLMHNKRNDKWRLAGYGFSTLTNLRFQFFKHFFFEYNLKGGFIHMPNIATTSKDTDRANQSFFFLERFGVGGVTFFL